MKIGKITLLASLIVSLMAAMPMFAFAAEADDVQSGAVVSGSESEFTAIEGLKDGLKNGAVNGMVNGQKAGLKDGLKNGTLNGLTNGLKNGDTNSIA